MIPFTLNTFRIFVPVSINHKETLAFLDTSASSCSLVSSLAEGLKVTEQRTIMGALGEVKVDQVQIKELTFLEETFRGLEATVDVSGAFDTLPFEAGITLDASTLLANPFLISFKEQTLGYTQQALRDDVETTKLELFKTLPFFQLTMGSQSLRSIFDLGAGFTTFNEAKRRRLAPDAKELYKLEVHDPTGAKQTIKVWQSPKLKLGNLSLGQTEFLSIDLTALEEKMDTEVDLIFGINTMLTANAVWLLDAQKNQLTLTTSSNTITRD